MSAAILGATDVFNPKQLSGLELWLTSDTGTYQTSGGLVASVDGDPVGEWQDQSGRGNHLAQTTANKRPLLRLGVQNNLPVIRADGVNDVLVGSLSASISWSFFIVAKVVAFAGNNGRVLSLGGASVLSLFDRDNATGWAFYQNEAGAAVSFGGASTVFGVISLVFTGPTVATAQLNNGVITTFDPVAFASAVVLTLGGSSVTPNDPCNCDIAELLVYNRAVSETDRIRVNNYLNSRWMVF